MDQKLYFATWKGIFSSNKTKKLASAHKNVEHLKILTNAGVAEMGSSCHMHKCDVKAAETLLSCSEIGYGKPSILVQKC